MSGVGKTNLSSQEVEALKIARKFLPAAMRNLVMLCNSPNESQRRQAIELLLKHTMADRNLQMMADGTIGPANNSGDLNITINKIDARLIEVMSSLPPHLMMKWATLMEEIEAYANDTGIEVFEGSLSETTLNTCKCGCGTMIKEGSTWARGHQWKSHVASDAVKANREGNPLFKHQQRKQLSEAGVPLSQEEHDER